MEPGGESADARAAIRHKIVEKVRRNLGAEAPARAARCDHCDVGELAERNAELEQRYNETFEALNKVRGVVLELSEQALEKEFRITHLERNLHEAEKKLKTQADALGAADGRLARREAELAEENAVLEGQIRRLCEVVRERDAKVLAMTGEHARLATEARDARARNAELMGQLDATCENLSTLARETAEREKMLNALEDDLKKKQAERQGLYLNEINRNKRMFINIKVKENLMAQIVQEKNAQISALTAEARALRDKLDRITATFKELSSQRLERKPTLAISNASASKVQCTVSTPCNMKMLNGTAKITL